MITDEQVKAAIFAYHDEHHFHPQIMTDMRKALEAYEQSKWVSVIDNFPESYEQVAVKRNGINGTFVAIQANKEWEQFTNGSSKISINDVAHWQPLPEFKE